MIAISQPSIWAIGTVADTMESMDSVKKKKMEERTEERATELVAGILKENLVLRRGSCYFFSCTLCPRLLRGEGQLSGQMREYVYTYFEMVTHSSGLLVAVITAAAAAKQL